MKAFMRAALGVCVLLSLLYGLSYASLEVEDWKDTFPPNTERYLVTQKKTTTKSFANASITGGSASSLWMNVKYNGKDVATTKKVYNNNTAERIMYLAEYEDNQYGLGLTCSVVARQTGVFNENARGQARTN